VPPTHPENNAIDSVCHQRPLEHLSWRAGAELLSVRARRSPSGAWRPSRGQRAMRRRRERTAETKSARAAVGLGRAPRVGSGPVRAEVLAYSAASGGGGTGRIARRGVSAGALKLVADTGAGPRLVRWRWHAGAENPGRRWCRVARRLPRGGLDVATATALLRALDIGSTRTLPRVAIPPADRGRVRRASRGW